jgi:hypothetical protein
MSEQVIATIPHSHPENRLDVVVGHDGAQSLHLELRALAWGEGIGWYCQQTLTLSVQRSRPYTAPSVRSSAGAGTTPPHARTGRSSPFHVATPYMPHGPRVRVGRRWPHRCTPEGPGRAACTPPAL